MLRIFTYLFLASCFLSCAPKVVSTTETITHKTPISEALPLQDSILNPQEPLFSIPIAAKTFTIDKLNQLYLITDRNEVIKYDSKGTEVFRYNNNFLENLEHIDATDPFNIILYYPDYLSVITLDRTMSKTGEFDLSKLNLIRVNAIGSSNDNNVWLYDDVAFKLKKINRSGTVLRQSVDINMQLGQNPQASYLVERDNNVYLNDPHFGILVFNIFGEFDSILDLQGIEKFQIINDRLFYKKGRQFFSYHLQSFNQKAVVLPINLDATDEVLIGKNRMFIKKINEVLVFEIEKN